MGHVILLGDSIFDNARYVPGRPAVIEQLKGALPREWSATLLAVDGACAEDVAVQLRKLPDEATHLVVSVGGNDALSHSRLLEDAGSSGPEAFLAMAEAQASFQRDYAAMVAAVVGTGRAVLLCTVYDAIPDLPQPHRTGLSIFNDVILRTAIRRRLPVLDLRSVCTDRRDYSEMSPIEPSEIGGAKVARAVRRVVVGHDFSRAECVVLAGD